MISALVWLGPSLVHSIHNWIEAKTKTSSMPPVETTHVVAAVVRRILRVGIIAIFAVLISSGDRCLATVRDARPDYCDS